MLKREETSDFLNLGWMDGLFNKDLRKSDGIFLGGRIFYEYFLSMQQSKKI